MVLNGGMESVHVARELLLRLGDFPPPLFAQIWDSDEGSCHLWQQGIEEVRKHDWHAAKVPPPPTHPRPAAQAPRSGPSPSRRPNRNPPQAPGKFLNGRTPPPPPARPHPSLFLCLLFSFRICTTALNVQVSCCDDQGRLV